MSLKIALAGLSLVVAATSVAYKILVSTSKTEEASANSLELSEERTTSNDHRDECAKDFLEEWFCYCSENS